MKYELGIVRGEGYVCLRKLYINVIFTLVLEERQKTFRFLFVFSTGKQAFLIIFDPKASIQKCA